MSTAVRRRTGVSDRTLLVVAVLLLALALRLALAIGTPAQHIGGDPAVYDQIAVSLAAGDGWSRPGHRAASRRLHPTALHPPAWPLLLGAAYAVTDHDEHLDEASTLRRPPEKAPGTAAGETAAARWTTGRLVNAVLGTLVVALTGLIAGELWGSGVGLLAAAVAALYPALAVLGIALLSEPLFVALELGAVYAVLRARRSGSPARWAVLAGVLCGLAVLTRANGAVLLLPLALGLWHVRPRWSRRALLAPAAVVAAAVLTVLPWSARNLAVLHAPVPVATDLGQTLAGTYNPTSAARDFRWRNTRHLPAADRSAVREPTEAARSSALTHDGLAFIGAHPLDVVRASVWNTARLLELDRSARGALAGEIGSRTLARVSFAGFGLLLMLALAGLPTRRARAAPAWLWSIPVLMWASTVPFAVNFSRFRAPIDPFLVLLGALALAAAGSQLGRLRRPATLDG
jgi:4-amino-4-deoxy-L-arabinose transferase-like glycosyltransferase